MAYQQGTVSDVAYDLQALHMSHEAIEAEKARKRAAVQEGLSSAYEIWSGSQNLKAEELMSNFGDELQYSPEYLKANPIKRMFTTGEGRLTFKEGKTGSDAALEALDAPKTLGGELKEFGGQAIDFGKGVYSGVVEGQSLKEIGEGAKVAFSKKAAGEGAKKIAQKTAEQSGKSFGKTAGTLGTLYSAYDLGTNWEEKSDAQKVSGGAAVALGIGSLFIPGLAPYAAAASGVDMGVNLFG
jgi:hypothetical protein